MRALGMALVCGVSGCGTLLSFEHPGPGPFSGVVSDVRSLGRGGEQAAFVFWDLRLSLVADVVLLPFLPLFM